MKIYLAGSVPKGEKAEKDYVNWRLQYQAVLGKVFPSATFIDPADASKDEGDSLAVVGQDTGNIKAADLIVVNGETKMGAGTSMELVIAKYFKKPVITILPKGSHHRRSNTVFHGKKIKDWIHPFIAVFSDLIVQKVEDIKPKHKSLKAKDIKIIDQAIKYFKSINV